MSPIRVLLEEFFGFLPDLVSEFGDRIHTLLASPRLTQERRYRATGSTGAIEVKTP
ncbi:MAG: hypothetical protein ABIZ81_10080 [Opitutaceae bacterium]